MVSKELLHSLNILNTRAQLPVVVSMQYIIIYQRLTDSNQQCAGPQLIDGQYMMV